MTLTINNEFSFGSKIGKCGIKDYKDCLLRYSEKFETASKLSENVPIFLDTNVLLQVYKVSLKSREAILDFLKNNKDRIYITNQIQREFVKNRLTVINDYFELVSDELCKDYQKEVTNSLQRYYDDKKMIFEDFEDVGENIVNIIEAAKDIYKLLESKVRDYKNSFGDIEFNDTNLELFSDFNIVDSVDSTELEFLKKEYDNLSKKIDKSKVKEFIRKKSDEVFPGVGDLIEKPDNPFGDYFIYHEILKFMKTNDRDAVLLTFDTTKGDWMKEDKSPHIHYVLNAFLNTGRFLFILDANRTFREILNIQTNSVIDKSIYRDFEMLKDHYLSMWSSLENGISTVGVDRGLILDYYQNPDIRNGFEQLIHMGYYGREILDDLDELTYFKNCLIEDRRILINSIPITEKKRIINKFEFILDSLPYKY